MELLSVMEFIGTVAFAVSGAIVAIQKGLDYYGITFLAIITAVGGGIIRDVIINVDLPVALANPIYVIVSIVSSFTVIGFYPHIVKHKKTLVFCDAIGLAAFTAIGAEVAIANGFNLPFVIIVFALLTGTGGGTLRDVFAQEIPYIFQKEIYAVASIGGALAFLISMNYASNLLPMYICFGVTLIIRLLAIRGNFHLKKVETGKE
ncbi:MAG: TRIC cation channel family protein [Peptostreptococcaceae bacterium]|nr:TRIC cation channel family protein [Peptostreptococcaceae bacterium]